MEVTPQDCLDAIEFHGSITKAADALGISRAAVRRRLAHLNTDKEIVAELVRVAKQKQAAQDKNRIQNKAFREHARVENAVSEYAQEITSLLKDLPIR